VKHSVLSVLATHVSGYWGASPDEREATALAIRNGDIGTSGVLRWKKLPLRGYTQRELERGKVGHGDIVMTTSGNCAEVAYVDRDPGRPVVATNFVRILRGRADLVDSKYLFHFLRTEEFRSIAARHVRGATIKNLSTVAALEAAQIPLPPIREQRRIAAILDEAEALRAASVRAVEQVEQLEAAQFARMFAHRRASRRLETLVAKDDRINYGVLQPGSDFPGGVPLIRAGDVGRLGVDMKKIKLISPKIESRYARSRVRGTEVLVVCVGSIGNVTTVDSTHIGANIARAVARVPVADPAHRTFVAAALKSAAVQRYLFAELRTVAQPTLNIKELAAAPIPEASDDEVGAFHEFAAELAARRRTLLLRVDLLDSLFASLQHRAFRGEL
jgi:type I restriction enzyme S subunit